TPDIGNASTGNSQPANVIAGDKFTNTTSGVLTVVYDIVPVSADGCKGDMVQITLTVNPEPVLSPSLNKPVCSDVASGIVLDVAPGSVAAASYNLTGINAAGGLVAGAGNATTGNGLSANVISSDAFTNTTGSPLTVVYDIVP
ncbi:unnamed protein product, partial [marine sediment metagenome]